MVKKVAKKKINLIFLINFAKLFSFELFGSLQNFECRGKIRKNLKYYHKGENSTLFLTDIEAQKRRYQMGLGTPVVYALTDEYLFFEKIQEI